MSIFEDNIEYLEGEGKITFDYLEAETQFFIEYKPFSIIIKTSKIHPGQLFVYNLGKLEGKLKDGRKISCQSMSMSSYSKYRITFVPLQDIIIGDFKESSKFESELYGSYLGQAKFTYKGDTIKLVPPKNVSEIIKFCKTYGDMLPGSKLSISSKKKNSIRLLNLSKQINLMLSLINGSYVRYNRYTMKEKLSKYNYKVWRNMSIENAKGTGIIDLNDINKVLKITLKKYNALTNEEQKCLQTVIGYLNATSGKYLEDCLLNIAQAWEILADTFFQEKINLDEDVKKLKTELKSTIKKWKIDNDIKYDTGIYSDRVIKSLYWETAIKKIEGLVKKEKLNVEKIELNIRKLVELRNSIAHTGRFRKLGEEFDNLKVLNTSILGIQVLIFSKLGYEGSIITRMGGLLQLEDISAFKNA